MKGHQEEKLPFTFLFHKQFKKIFAPKLLIIYDPSWQRQSMVVFVVQSVVFHCRSPQ